jgi:hypothetical protein
MGAVRTNGCTVPLMFVPPAATHSQFVTHETPATDVCVAGCGFAGAAVGVGVIDQVEPFHATARGSNPVLGSSD